MAVVPFKTKGTWDFMNKIRISWTLVFLVSNLLGICCGLNQPERRMRLDPWYYLPQAIIFIAVTNILMFVLIPECKLDTPDSDPEDMDIRISREQKSRDHRQKIVVTTVLESPYMTLKQHTMGSFITGNERFEGYMADIMMNLSQAIGFDYTIRMSMDGKYGESDLEGNWNGIIGEIQRGEADIAVGPITVTMERSEVVEFTDPFMTFRSTALVKRPRKKKKQQQKLETVEDLLQSDTTYGVIDGSIIHRLMRTAEEPFYRQMWSRMLNFWPTPFVQSIEEGIERARREKYAFIVDTPLAEYVIGQEPCEFYTIEPFLSTRRFALALRKGDLLKNVINDQLHIMHEKHILAEFYLKWWRSSCDLYLPEENHHASNSVEHSTTILPNEQGEVGHWSSSARAIHSNQLVANKTFIFVLFSVLYCYLDWLLKGINT